MSEAIPPDDQIANQEKMFGVHSFNVKDQYDADVNHVKIPASQFDKIDTSVNRSFVDAAPNMPFKLFGIEKLFSHSSKG